MQLHHNSSSRCVLSTDCFPAVTGECQTTRIPHKYVTFILLTHYYYLQIFSRNYLLIYILTYLFNTHCSRVLLETIIIYKLVKKFPTCMEPKISSPDSKVPTTCPYPQPDQSSPYFSSHFL
jgi:hypothetical protein